LTRPLAAQYHCFCSELCAKTNGIRYRKEEKAQALFVKFLEAAQAYRTRIDNFQLSQTGLQPEDWLCVVGVDSETRVRMRITRTDRDLV